MARVQMKVTSQFNDEACGAFVVLRALSVQDLGNGFVRVKVPSRPVTHEEGLALHNLFPNSGREVGELLSKEAMFAAISDEHDVEVGENTPTDLLRSEGTKMY